MKTKILLISQNTELHDLLDNSEKFEVISLENVDFSKNMQYNIDKPDIQLAIFDAITINEDLHRKLFYHVEHFVLVMEPKQTYTVFASCSFALIACYNSRTDTRVCPYMIRYDM